MQTKNQDLLTQEFLQHLLLQAPAAIAVVVGKDLRYVQANALYQQLFNRSESELLGNTVKEAFPEIEHEGTLDVFNNVYSTGVAYRATDYLFTWDRQRDGTLEQGYFNFIAQPILNNSGEVYAIMLHAFEVTQQVEDKKKIEESERQFRQIADSMPQIVWTARPDGFIDYYNKKWYDYTGFSEGYGDESWIPILHPDDVDNCLKTFYHAIATGENYHIEYRFKDPEDPEKFRWFMGLANPVRDLDGKIVKWFGSCTDITDQKEAAALLEKSVAERTATLEELTKSFEHAEQISDMGNFRWNITTGELIWSKNLYAIFGVTPENFRPSIESIIPFTHTEDLNQVLTQTERAINDKKAYSITYRIHDAFGREKYISGTGTMHCDLIGNDIMTGTLQDVTAVKLQEISLSKKNAELKAANHELEAFAYISSHDLQEPLRKIQALSSNLRETEVSNLSERGSYIFGRIQSAAQRMQALINDLLAYSRTSTEKREFTTVDLQSIVEKAIADLNEEMEDKKAMVKCISTCEIHIIPYQFRQLLDNLLSNSLKFVKPDLSPEVHISGRTFRNDGKELPLPKGDYCHISFEDNGIGFDQQYSQKIFQVFQRLHDRNTYAGTGIGLAIVKKIIDNHGGHITGSGNPGKGSRFDIYIPQATFRDNI